MAAPPLAEQVEGGMLVDGGPSCGDCSHCGGCCGDPCCDAGCCSMPCAVLTFENLEFFGGVQGFTGPANRGQSGSFGFHEGVNWGSPFPLLFPNVFGVQVGFRGVQSNFEGAEFTSDYRSQTFLTAGLFRRVDWGLQGGVVFDHMHDEWCYGADLTQLRGELSWVFPSRHEVGFWFAGGSSNDDVTTEIATVAGQTAVIQETMLTTDLYAFFYRHCFDACAGVEGRLFAGFTGESDGLIGAEIRTALTPRFSVQSDFTYLTPETPDGGNSHTEESWNVAISLVWFPGCRPPIAGNYYRPLFSVASNGTFLADRQ